MATINFKGKELVRNYHLTVPYHELVPDGKKSLTKKVGLNDNLIIHGDNLLALKALLPTYAGKVKCIYIDPPYNTGNERWSYNDNVNSPMMKEWLGKVVDKDDLTRHDKWLCMMMPRLKLLCELLSDDGVIFVSIDDNELQHLRMLMNEVFGEDNFRNIIVVRRGVKSVQAQFETIDRLAIGAEYVLVYTKSKDYKFPTFHIELDDEKEGSWNNHWRGTNRPTMRYKLFGILPETGQWRWSQTRSLAAINNYQQCLKDIAKKEDATSQEEIDEWYLKQLEDGDDPDLLRLSINGKPEHYVPPTSTKFASSHWADLKPNGNAQVKQIFGKKIFDNPKSVDLIKRIIKFSGAEKTDIILDSFAGTGTTAHAVLALNKEEDDANRKFILFQIPEEIEKDNPAYKLGFKEIVDITAERVRRVSKGVKGAKDDNLQKGLGGSFSYYELGKPIDTERILKGKDLPSFVEMARYIFYTATGEEFNEKKVNDKTGLIGESKEYQVYLLYKPNMEYLKSTALTLERAEALGKFAGKKRLVFGPAKYLDQEHLERLHIDFAQLPFEIYQKQ